MILSIAMLAINAMAVLAKSSSVCPSDNSHASGADLQKILDYKNSDHQIMAAYFRSWRDIASDPIVNKAALDDLPDCVDIAFVFPDGSEPDAYWTTLKNKYVPTLRSRGTKVVRTISLDEVLNANYTNDPAGYEALAQHLLDTFVTIYDLDGLDVDVERYLSTADAQKVSGVFKVLSKSLGPKSGTGKLLIYDTNLYGDIEPFMTVHPYIDYVLVQSYGRSIPTVKYSYESFSPYISSKQFLIGFSFYEERGEDWGDVTLPMKSSRAYQFAQWQPDKPSDGRKGGIFSYATDRDGVLEGSDGIVPTNYTWTRGLISAMNP